MFWVPRESQEVWANTSQSNLLFEAWPLIKTPSSSVDMINWPWYCSLLLAVLFCIYSCIYLYIIIWFFCLHVFCLHSPFFFKTPMFADVALRPMFFSVVVSAPAWYVEGMEKPWSCEGMAEWCKHGRVMETNGMNWNELECMHHMFHHMCLCSHAGVYAQGAPKPVWNFRNGNCHLASWDVGRNPGSQARGTQGALVNVCVKPFRANDPLKYYTCMLREP